MHPLVDGPQHSFLMQTVIGINSAGGFRSHEEHGPALYFRRCESSRQPPRCYAMPRIIANFPPLNERFYIGKDEFRRISTIDSRVFKMKYNRYLFLGPLVPLLAVGHAVPSTINAPGAPQPRAFPARFDIRSSGQYMMVNCGSDRGPQLDSLLQNLWAALLPVIQDARLSNPSPAFRAFFKDSSNAPFVAEVLRNVTTGVARHPPILPYSNGSPTFLCPTAPGQMPFTKGGQVVDLYTHCLQSKIPVAAYAHPSPYIFLCPKFWTGPYPNLLPQNSCLSVRRYINKFRGNGQTLIAFKMWILLEEIVHYYIFASPKASFEPEIYDVNKAFRLSADQAVINGVSYAYYAASKPSTSVNEDTTDANQSIFT